MSRSLSWIDPGELKETLSRIGITVEAEVTPPPPSFRPERPEPPDPAEARPIPAAPALYSASPPKMAPITPPTLEAIAPPHFDPPISVSERIDRLVRWLEPMIGTAPLYLADPEGLLMFARGLPEPLALTSVALDRALRPIRGLLGTNQVGAVTLEVDGGRLVQTIWVNTPLGRAALGILVDRPLEPRRVEVIREALRRVFDW